MPTDRERAMETAQRIVAEHDDEEWLATEQLITDALLEAEALGVEWAAKAGCRGCRDAILYADRYHDYGQDSANWPGSHRWYQCASVTEVCRVAQLRAQKLVT